MAIKGQSRLSEAVAAEENARARIAADIHDDTIQTLGAVALSLQNARDGSADPSARSALDDACRHVRDTAERLRRVMFELMPPSAAGDLRSAIDDYCSVLFAGSGMTWEVIGTVPEGALAPEAGAVAYRVTQEAVRNALRHSGGSRVRCELDCGAGELVISVSDDGIGLGEGWPAEPTHAGLQIICQRAAAIDGTVDFGVGLAGQGASVLMRIPLTWNGLA
jgi:signal transduction histidine kinase